MFDDQQKNPEGCQSSPERTEQPISSTPAMTSTLLGRLIRDQALRRQNRKSHSSPRNGSHNLSGVWIKHKYFGMFCRGFSPPPSEAEDWSLQLYLFHLHSQSGHLAEEAWFHDVRHWIHKTSAWKITLSKKFYRSLLRFFLTSKKHAYKRILFNQSTPTQTSCFAKKTH